MNTVVSDWQIVSIIENDELVGAVLWGNCIDDITCRFNKGDYICTSQIVKLNLNSNLVTTASGNLYQVIGKGRRSKINFEDFELLRHGFSPQQIKALHQVKASVPH